MVSVQATYTSESTSPNTKFGFLLFIALLLIIPFSSANAGFFSFLGSLFDRIGEVKEERFVNSQNVALLRAAVNPDPNPAKGGGDISTTGGALLPDTGPSGTIVDIQQDDSQSDQISIYVVREGDSLGKIAEMFDVTVNTLIWANDIGRGGLIRQGQTLVILPLSGLTHTVAKGDTIAGIAKKYKGDVQEVMEFNHLSEGASLTIGDELIIPGGEKAIPRSAGVIRVVRGTNVPSYSGYYVRPVSGARRSQGLHGWNAVDLAAPRGSAIVAAASGKVMISRYGWNGGYGNYIVIQHYNGTQTLYSHNDNNIVSAGWTVVKGQVIGYVGSTGRSTGPHVHFEIRGARNPF